MKRIILIKLGGSLITNKSVPFCVNQEVLENIVQEIKAMSGSQDCTFIIGHGGGSFPHVYAKEYKINDGFTRPDSYYGFCKVQDSAATLNRIVVKKFIDAGLSVSTFQISSICKQCNGIIREVDLNPLYKMIEYGIIPVVYGDVAFDEAKGCSVISTEEIFRFICEDIIINNRDYKIERIILCGNVDGVLTADPNCNSATELISVINSANYQEVEKYLGGAYGFDVTGGMRHKVSKMLHISGRVATRIINGRLSGELSRAILGQQVGTLIESGMEEF